jgi:DNA uptake protein ComE-like DNA-binding protein
VVKADRGRAIVPGVGTPGEKKALLFLSFVAVLGAGARLVSANQVPVPTPAERAALDAQIRVVDSVRRGARGERRGTRRKAKDRAVRADTGPRPWLPGTPHSPAAPQPSPLDVDLASTAQLESLPGIGPSLARRIVASRDSAGPFGSLEELQLRVRGVGPALGKRLAPAVTFSGPRRPSSAERTEPFGNGGTPARAKRRRGH